MKKITILLTISFLLCFNIGLKAQNEKIIEKFVNKVDNYLADMSKNTSDIFITKKINNRKIKISGKFDNNKNTFKQKIKYFKGGTKKEIIKIKYIGSIKYYTLLTVVLINDKYFYIQKISYSPDNLVKKITEEKLINGTIYQKTEFDNNENKKTETNAWKIN